MADPANKESRGLLRSLGDIAETMLITLFCFTLVFTYLLRIVTVSGGSMESTLMPDDKLLVNLMDRAPEQGDIVLVNARNSYTLADDGSVKEGKGLDTVIVKRVIACEGQTIDIDFGSGKVTVDGKRLHGQIPADSARGLYICHGRPSFGLEGQPFSGCGICSLGKRYRKSGIQDIACRQDRNCPLKNRRQLWKTTI